MALAPGISRKLRKLLEARGETEDAAIGALETLGEFYGPNSAAARRGLRGTLEKRALSINDGKSAEFIVRQRD